MKRIFICGSAAFFLQSCAYRPELPPSSRVPLPKLVDALQCELFQSHSKASVKHRWFERWAATFTLTLRVDESQGVGISTFDGTFPMIGGTWNIGAGADVSQRNSRTVDVKYTVKLNALRRDVCERSEKFLVAEGPFKSPFGLNDWVEKVVAGFDHQPQSPDSFSYETEFFLRSAADIHGGATAVHLSGGARASASRSDTDTLLVSFADDPPPRVPHVYVENLPPLAQPAVSSAAAKSAPAKVQVFKGSVNPDTIRTLNQLQTNFRLQNLNVTVSPR